MRLLLRNNTYRQIKPDALVLPYRPFQGQWVQQPCHDRRTITNRK